MVAQGGGDLPADEVVGQIQPALTVLVAIGRPVAPDHDQRGVAVGERGLHRLLEVGAGHDAAGVQEDVSFPQAGRQTVVEAPRAPTGANSVVGAVPSNAEGVLRHTSRP